MNTMCPLIEQNFDKEGCLKSGSCKLSIFANMDIQFVSAIEAASGFGAIKKNSFEVLFYKGCDSNYSNLKIDGNTDLKEKILNIVRSPQCTTCQTPCSCKKTCKCIKKCKCASGKDSNETPKGDKHKKCKCRDHCKCKTECKCKSPCSCNKNNGCNCATCYKLVGFFMRGREIFFAIESTCIKKSNSKYLYLVRSYLNAKTLEIDNKLELFAAYDLYSFARNNQILKCKSKKLHATGFSYKNGELYILTTYGKGGFLWTVDLCGCKDKLKLRTCKGIILEIKEYPVSITHLDNEQLFIIGNLCHGKKFNYHVAKIPFRPKKCMTHVEKELTRF